jgi:hypothetical protein
MAHVNSFYTTYELKTQSGEHKAQLFKITNFSPLPESPISEKGFINAIRRVIKILNSLPTSLFQESSASEDITKIIRMGYVTEGVHCTQTSNSERSDLRYEA